MSLKLIKDQKIMEYKEGDTEIARIILSRTSFSPDCWYMETVNWFGEYGNLPLGEQLDYLNKINQAVLKM